jgi:hypothetical protein
MSIYLLVEAGNKRARSFYENEGFREVRYEANFMQYTLGGLLLKRQRSPAFVLQKDILIPLTTSGPSSCGNSSTTVL